MCCHISTGISRHWSARRRYAQRRTRGGTRPAGTHVRRGDRSRGLSPTPVHAGRTQLFAPAIDGAADTYVPRREGAHPPTGGVLCRRRWRGCDHDRGVSDPPPRTRVASHARPEGSLTPRWLAHVPPPVPAPQSCRPPAHRRARLSSAVGRVRRTIRSAAGGRVVSEGMSHASD